MSFGLFEPLFGNQMPKKPSPTIGPELPETPKQAPKPEAPKKKKPVKAQDARIEFPQVIQNQFGQLFNELDQSKVIIVLLIVAVVAMMVFFFYLNTRQKSQKQLIYKMQKQLNRLRG